MHLVEALLVLAEVAPDSGALREASALVELLGARWLDARTGALGENFDPLWRPLAGEAGRAVEPGHHFEWVWLLDRLDALDPSDSTRALAARLFDFGRRFGVDADGGVFDQLDAPASPRAAVWLQTGVKVMAVGRCDGDANASRVGAGWRIASRATSTEDARWFGSSRGRECYRRAERDRVYHVDRR
jgi:mannose/cellobiose epimerase-like protein (N-acyl-D-glucosamine 2-epimerase family)